MPRAKKLTIRDGIYDLLDSVEIDTKEMGRCKVDPWMSQRLLIDGVSKGLQEDVHEFCVLKCRQVAITTAASIIELFWALVNPGTQGAIIADRTDNLERLRRIFAAFLETLPPQWKGPDHKLVKDNRNSMVFANKSVIDLLAAASNPDLGASRALNMAHCTECSLWKSATSIDSLRASLARENPNRLFIFESIANGFNWFYDFWNMAKKDRHMMAIFIGFWAAPTYWINRDHPDYKVYMEPDKQGRFSLTDEEITRARIVKQDYNYIVKPEQIAWWRRESESTSEEAMLRHYPWHEKECFIASGSGFFPARQTLNIYETLCNSPPVFKAYKYTFDSEGGFLASRVEQTMDLEEAQLRVWELPVTDPELPPRMRGVYVLGCDPAGGGGDQADDHCISVWRCYANRIVQVAEYLSNKPYTYQLAWVLCHLAGAYKDHVVNIEVTGIGAAVLPEVSNLRALAMRSILQGVPDSEKILDMIGNVRWYLYKRADTMTGAGSVINWKTNIDNKFQIFSEFRDSLKKNEIDFRSPRMVHQMQAIVNNEGHLGAGEDTGEKDDAITAAILAHRAWVDPQQGCRPRLVANNMTWDNVHGTPRKKEASEILNEAFSRHWEMINQKARRKVEVF